MGIRTALKKFIQKRRLQKREEKNPFYMMSKNPHLFDEFFADTKEKMKNETEFADTPKNDNIL